MKELHEYLIADETIGRYLTEIYAGRVPEDEALPAIFYTLLGDSHEHTQQGLLGLTQTRWRFNVLSETKAVADELANALLLALCNWTGTGIHSVVCDLDYEQYEPYSSEDAGVFHRIMDFLVWRDEPYAALSLRTMTDHDLEDLSLRQTDDLAE